MPTAGKLKEWLRRRPLLFAIARSQLYGGRLLYGRLHGLLLTGRIWRRYARGHDIRKLHIGCGDLILPGWLNTDGFPRRLDVAYCDATRRFPFPDECFDYVFSEHMIEHITYAQARNMLEQCRRVLKPGGTIRISTPDLEKIYALTRADLTPIEKSYLDYASAQSGAAMPGQAAFVINAMMREWGHVFIYNAETLRALLRAVGFVKVSAVAPGESEDPVLRNLERHGEIFPDPAFNLVESMVFEAIRAA